MGEPEIMAGTKNHDFHILPPSIWPMFGSFSALALTTGGVLFMHEMTGGVPFMMAGLLGILITMYSWWGNVIQEGKDGDHTPIVQLHLRYGTILFIAYEAMFFVGWFWAFFDFSLFPSELAEAIGGQWPPKDMKAVLDAYDLPLLNTLILLCSGTTLTWSHHALLKGDYSNTKKGLWATILLGVVFSALQVVEYMHAPFAFGQNTYGSIFYMATGFHGFHVFIGVVFLIVCLKRTYSGDFTPARHFGFESAAWYWHFVDYVWLFLYVAIYVWGNAGFPTH